MESSLRTVDLTSKKQYRIIPSAYPPINFFENLVDPTEMEVLWEIENLTNERLRQQTGEIRQVLPEDRLSGPGSSVVMAAFTHIHCPSRFSDGSFGIYYAALSIETAIRETAYHRERFFQATHEEPCEIAMRLYEGTIEKPVHDIRDAQFINLHDPEDYLQSQQFGKNFRMLRAWGLIYNSVRHPGGHCLAAFRPPTVSIPTPTAHFRYLWNGRRITEVLNYEVGLVLT